eukprot:2517458-Pyramimonas_sp.AAC.1
MDWAGGDEASSAGSVPRSSPISQFSGMSRPATTATGSHSTRRGHEDDQEPDRHRRGRGKGNKGKSNHNDQYEHRGHDERDG